MKCHWCNEKDDKEKHIDPDDPKKRYHTEKCLEAWEKHKAFLAKEKEQKDALYEKLLRVHKLNNYQEIPPLFYMKIEEIRNNSGLLGKVDKRYKEGVAYNAISYGYNYCAPKIKEALRNIKFDSKLGEMQYCLAIVRNNLVDAYRHAINSASVQKEKIEEITKKTDTLQTISKRLEEKKIENSKVNDKAKDDDVDLTMLFD